MPMQAASILDFRVKALRRNMPNAGRNQMVAASHRLGIVREIQREGVNAHRRTVLGFGQRTPGVERDFARRNKVEEGIVL